ncbi:response regulator transcription factor [Pedobacter agri]|uniref:response regulator transcription factor n=1 Tax=Pedobacter agri TaxID=454586 RepID=UPI0027883CF1|nr:response regulator transcription factor [Pedobacter agri]MDQ1141450.1 DNA-binding NarL/FixJ family response regulator [Pedobacter agri]
MKKIKVFLVDDHDILMDGIEAILKDVANLVVVGKANSVDTAQELIKISVPDLILTDISLGEKSGLDLTKYVKKEYPQIKVMVLSMHDDILNMTNMLKAGASGYLLKNVKNAELHKAIVTVMEGGSYIQDSIASKLKNVSQSTHQHQINNLSAREIEIIRLISKEHTSAEIGKMLFISEHTVETHRKNIWRKTGVKSTIGLLNFAKDHHLLF